MDDVGITLLSRLPEIAVEDGLDVERGVACRHGQDACSLFDYDEILVLIDDLQVAALEEIVLLRAAHGHFVASY